MRALSLAASLVLLAALCPPACAQEDPALVLDMYLALINRGDYEGAFRYCAPATGAADDAAMRELRDSVDRLVQETDVGGVLRALSLFAPLVKQRLTWRQVDSSVGQDSAWVDYEATATISFPQRVYFRRVAGQWRIDVAQTIQHNAQGTKVESILSESELEAACATNLQLISQAFRAYAAEHGGKLPEASRWREAIAPYLPQGCSCGCPAVGGGEGLAMNERLSGLRADQIADLDRTILVFDAPPGVISGADESALDRRHGGKGHVLLLGKGGIALVQTTRGYKWSPGPASGERLRPAGRSTARLIDYQGQEYVALREALSSFAATIQWSESRNATIVSALGHRAVIEEAKSKALVDGKPVYLGAPARTIGGRLVVPPGFLTRAFGLWAQWGDGSVSFVAAGGAA